MKNKKRILLLALAVCLVAILSYSTLAWFVVWDEADNIFEFGDVDIVQHEQQHDANGQLVPFVNNKMLLPVLGDDPTAPNDYYQEKIVTVENVGDMDAYVQTLVAVPKDLDDHGVLKIYDANGAPYWTKVDADPTKDGIQPLYTVTVDQIAYNVYCYRYRTVLTVTQKLTQPCIEYVYIDSRADMNLYDTDNDGKTDTAYFVMNGVEISSVNVADTVNVLVASQGIQTEGFADAEAALNGIQVNPWS